MTDFFRNHSQKLCGSWNVCVFYILRVRQRWPEKEAVTVAGRVNDFLCWLDPDHPQKSPLWPHFCFHFGYSKSFNNHGGINNQLRDRSPR